MTNPYLLENKDFSVHITKIGAEICSFKNKKTDKEYIWQADPNIWGSHAPVLFPIVGGLKNNTFFFNDQAYQLARHGFVRRNTHLTPLTQDTNELVLLLKSNEETKKAYPFDFEFQISFKLLQNKLLIAHRVINNDVKELYFSLGAHPAFNCPLQAEKTYSDYHLEFNETENLNTWNLDQEGLISEEGKQIMDSTKQLKLHNNLFDKDALIFKSLKSRRVSLCEQENELIRVDFQDFSSLGIWAKPAAPFICIEPWLGYADAAKTSQRLEEKEAILSLEKGKEFNASYAITICE